MKNIGLSPMLWDAGGATGHVNHQRPHQTWRLMTCLILVLPLCLVIFEQTYGMPRMESTQQITKKETVHIPRTKHTTTVKVTPEVEPIPSSPFSNFVFHGNLPFQDRPSLSPLEILETYISQHSEESLQRDWETSNTDHRRFAIVHYSCPHQLGNRLHHFYNDFLLAFLSNRTILWRYWDREACIHLGNQYDHEICSDHNRTLSIDNPAQACDPIMEMAPWIPRYDVWSHRLNLSHSVQVWVRSINPHNAPHPPPPGVERIPWTDEIRDSGMSPDIGVSSKWKLAVFQPLVGVLGLGFVKKHLTLNAMAVSRAQSLFSFGPEFWHGALFHNAFRLQPHFLETVQPLHVQQQPNIDPVLGVYSIALHSRHTDVLDDGANVTKEIECLRTFMREMKLLNATVCRVFIMSDRLRTLTSLQSWLEEAAVNCEVTRAKHDTGSKETGLEEEHGPFAGAGFVQDLELASREVSRSLNVAWIGHSRSSSMLLLEWLNYRRAIRFWKDYGLQPSRLPKVSRCQLPG